jgi:hypothetical protein
MNTYQIEFNASGKSKFLRWRLEKSALRFAMKSHMHVAVFSIVILLTAFPIQCKRRSASSVSFHKVYFLNEQNGWILGATSNESSILQSIDGGGTWQRRYRCSEGLFNIKFANARIGWVVGGNGSILRTTDGS